MTQPTPEDLRAQGMTVGQIDEHGKAQARAAHAARVGAGEVDDRDLRQILSDEGFAAHQIDKIEGCVATWLRTYAASESEKSIMRAYLDGLAGLLT